VLVTREFVFVHVPKTGGSFMRAAIEQAVPAEDLGDHVPYSKLPAEYRHLPAIGFIRDPLAWYVSWFEHMQRHPPKRGEVPDLGYEELLAGDFRGFVRESFRMTPDFCTWEFSRQLTGASDVGRAERLREDFLAFLDRHTIRNEKLRECVATLEPLNVGGYGDFERYYDAETRGLVEDAPASQWFRRLSAAVAGPRA
jgi:hypothetical protein